MGAAIFNGPSVKILKDILKFKDGRQIINGTIDPSSVAVDAPRSSLYLEDTVGGLQVYRKEDSGSTTNWTKLDVWTKQDILDILAEVNNEPNGFPNYSTDSTLSHTDVLRTFYIAPVAAEFVCYSNGNKIVKTALDSVIWPDIEGVHFFYYDEAGTLTTTQTFDINIILKYAYVGFLYWDATNSETIIFGNERHGTQMDGATHSYLHLTNGSQYRSGASTTVFSIDGTGNVDLDAQIRQNSGNFSDEDITYTNITQDDFFVLYRDGAAGNWRRGTKSTFPVLTTGTGRAAWNEFTGGAWQLTELTNNNYVLAHVFATNGLDTDTGYVVIMGQNEYGNLASARAGANVEISNLLTGGLPFSEFIAVSTVILQTSNSYSNTVKSRTRTTDTGDNYVSWLGQNLSTTVVPTSHSNLSDLINDDHFRYQQNSSSVTALTTSTSLTNSTERNSYITLDGSVGAIVITLPPIATIQEGYSLIFKAIDVSNAVSIKGNASENIEGSNTYSFNSVDEIIKVSYTGTEWSITSSSIPKVSSGILNVVTKTAAYTLTGSDDVILADATSAAFTLTLPAAAANSGKKFYFEKIDSSTNLVTIDPNAAETIDGDDEYTLGGLNNKCIIYSDGINWVATLKPRVFAKYRSDAGHSIPDFAATTVNFEDKIEDSHNAVTIGASWRFTSPISREYKVDTAIFWDNDTNLNLSYFDIRRNGTLNVRLDYRTSTDLMLNGSTSIYIAKDAYVEIKVVQDDSTGSARTLETTAFLNWITILGE